MSNTIDVSVSEGVLRGKQSTDYHGGRFYSFLGIPYAKAPIGELRFRAPQSPEPWQGVKNATKPGAECPQYSGLAFGKEDNCLNLNVFTKNVSPEFKKPVMVWIHSGGFVPGLNRADRNYGPEFLMTADVVLVTINYRLGILGFLSLTDPALDVPGNAGMKDQVMALKWVQNNIEFFGGDQDNVTIFGQSAGSAAVHALVMSPLAKGLFHKAICQSGCILNPWATGLYVNGVEIAKAMGYPTDSSEEFILKKLQNASVRAIMEGQSKFQGSFTPHNIRPVAIVVEYPNEGAFLTEHPRQILLTGKYTQVPMMMGYNSYEGLFFAIMSRVSKEWSAKFPMTLESDVLHNCDIDPTDSVAVEKAANDIKRFYYKNEDISQDNMHIRYTISNDTNFAYGILKSIQLHKKTTSQPIYAYKMNIVTSLNIHRMMALTKNFRAFLCCLGMASITGSSRLLKMATEMETYDIPGACHGDDLFYLFKAAYPRQIDRNSVEDKWIQKFVKLWTNFAKTGNPTPQDLDPTLLGAVWKPVGNTNVDKIFNIDNCFRCSSIGSDEGDMVAFWDKYHVFDHWNTS